MFNLMRFYSISRLLLTVTTSWLLLLSLSFPTLASSNLDSFNQHLYSALPALFDDKEMGIADPVIKEKALALWQQITTNGFVEVSGAQDKIMRAVFTQIQYHTEQEMIKALPQRLDKNQTLPAVWIIHTPLIATPLVTQDAPSPTLIDSAVLHDKDKTRVKTALARATLMRQYLAKGGLLIVAYQKDRRVGKEGRTATQIAIFEALKKQYPQQIIEFPIEPTLLPDGKYPDDKIGATYLLQMPDGELFAMTNRGLQINAAQDGASWGVWFGAHNPRLNNILNFLAQSGLAEVLTLYQKQLGVRQPNPILDQLSQGSGNDKR